MITEKTVKRVINTPEWQAVHKHIVDTIASLSTLDDINFTNPVESAIEGRARQVAVEKLTAILAPFVQVHTDADNQTLVKEKAQDAGLE